MRLSPVALVLLASISHAGNTWYVDQAAIGPGDGSQASPYTSIAYAIDRPSTVNGDTILVLPGTYTESVDFDIKHLELRSVGGPLQTRIVAPLALYGSDAVTVSGFHLLVSDTGVNSYNVTISDCIVECTQPLAAGSKGVVFLSDIVMRNCTVFGFAEGLSHFGLVPMGSGAVENTLFFGNGLDLQLAAVNGGEGSTLQYCYFKTGGSSVWTMDPPSSAPTPGLWNAAGSDFHLAPLSTCIDGGNPTQTDPDGSRRDIGAIPYDAAYAATSTTYCTPKTNSKGCAPSVSSTGTASLSGPDDFVLTTSSLLNKKNGSYIWSYAPKATPFAGGTLCIKLPLVRGTQLNTGGNPTGLDCSGSLVWPFTQSYMAQKNVPAGAVIYAQAWARDSGFAAPDNSQLSNAIVFQVAP